MLVFKTGKKLLWLMVFGCWITVCVTPLSAGETVYRCTDEQGRVLFQQTPCAEKGEVIDIEVDSSIWSPVTNAKKILAKGVKKPRKKTRVSRTRSNSQDKVCWKNKQKLERIHWKLRKGYKPAQGERLRQQRRELEAYKKEFCRNY